MTVTHWAKTAAFKAAVKAESEKTEAREVLESCLKATDKDGRPNWGVRLRAAIALDGHGDTAAAAAEVYEEDPDFDFG